MIHTSRPMPPPGCLSVWYAAAAHKSAEHWIERARAMKFPETRAMCVRAARTDWHRYLREMRTIKERT